MTAPTIENWAVVSLGSAYCPPEAAIKSITGTVFDHSSAVNGKPIRTSALVSLDVTNRIAVTRNTTYILGTPNPSYAAAYPEVNV